VLYDFDGLPEINKPRWLVGQGHCEALGVFEAGGWWNKTKAHYWVVSSNWRKCGELPT
jgi:hypothetical protein